MVRRRRTTRRKYLPYGLTAREKRDPKLRAKLSRCIRKVEKLSCPRSAKRRGKYNYAKCTANPVAVCRAALQKKRRGNPNSTRRHAPLGSGIRLRRASSRHRILIR